MTERELLEFAAKAAGLPLADWHAGRSDWLMLDAAAKWPQSRFHPLTDEGDALRLAVKLGLWVHIDEYGTGARRAGDIWHTCEAHLNGGIEQATRRAIVCAAAEIGRAME